MLRERFDHKFFSFSLLSCEQLHLGSANLWLWRHKWLFGLSTMDLHVRIKVKMNIQSKCAHNIFVCLVSSF